MNHTAKFGHYCSFFFFRHKQDRTCLFYALTTWEFYAYKFRQNLLICDPSYACNNQGEHAWYFWNGYLHVITPNSALAKQIVLFFSTEFTEYHTVKIKTRLSQKMNSLCFAMFQNTRVYRSYRHCRGRRRNPTA